MSELPPEAYVASLAGFRAMNVHRLGALLRHHSPRDAWEVVQGRVPGHGLVAKVLADQRVRSQWGASVRERPPEAVWQRCQELGLRVVPLASADYPVLLLDDPLPPPVLFALGSLSLLHGRRVAMVGTRNATAAGREAARSIAHGLASVGVHVVSGLARGIDGHAHRGVLSAEGEGRPIGVVASGLDVVYPREHRDLWEAAANCGLLLSEAPPGTAPEPYRFPLRNRIVAAISEVVVVVESRERGGSLITAAQALERNVPLMAVPGPVTQRASAGSNELLRDGAAPVLDAGDVLTLLDLDHRRADITRPLDQRVPPAAGERVVYRVLSDEPRTLDGVVLLTGLTYADAAMRLVRLESAGWIAQADGWYECVGSPLR